MNILILNWRDPKNPESGGAEVVTFEHAKAWVEAGHTVTWYTSHVSKLKRIEKISGIRFVRIGHRYMIYAIAPFMYFFSGKYDMVIDEIHGIPFFTPLYVGKPKIAFIHEVAGEIWDHMFHFPLNIIGKSFERAMFVVYKRQIFMTVSQSTKQDLIREGIPEEQIHVIQNGIHLPPLKSLPYKEHVPTFIFVSRLVRMKGIEDVIDAFALIRKKHRNARLWIVGDGEKGYIESLRQRIDGYGLSDAILLKGYVSQEEKRLLMQKAHILLHASVKEGWGLVVTEAASQGTPSIVYDVAGLRDSVRNGKTGIVLSQNTPEEMAHKASSLLKDKVLYRTFQEHCLKSAKELSWEKATEKSLLLLESLQS